MKPLLLFPVLTVAYVTGRGPSQEDTYPRRPSLLARVVRAFRAFNADNLAILERYLRKHRPWPNT